MQSPVQDQREVISSTPRNLILSQLPASGPDQLTTASTASMPKIASATIGAAPVMPARLPSTVGAMTPQTIDGASQGRTDEAATIQSRSPASASCPQCDLPEANHMIRWK
jgi:hypothetical protein